MPKRWTLALPFLVLLAGCEEPAFDEAAARALLPEAARVDARTWAVVRTTAATPRSEDVAREPSLPLLAMAVTSVGYPAGGRRDFRILDLDRFYDAFPPADEAPTFLRPEWTERVTARQEGGRAHGEVWFRAPGAFEGRVRYAASRRDGRWAITLFEFPWTRARIERRDGAWTLVRYPGWRPGGGSPPPVAVPEVSAAEAAPDPSNAIPLVLSARGEAWVGAERCDSFARFRAVLDAAANALPREPDGASAADLVLVADEDLPWQVVQWALQAGAGPRTKLYRVHLAVRHRASGDTGVLATFLPKDRGIGPTPVLADVPSTRITLLRRDTGAPAQPAAVYHELLRLREQRGEVPRVTIAAPPPSGPRVPYGFVVQVVDAVRRAGAIEVQFEGTATGPWSSGHGGHPGDPGGTDLRDAILQAAALPAGVPVVKIDGKELLATDPPPPPVPDGDGPPASGEPAPFRHEADEPPGEAARVPHRPPAEEVPPDVEEPLPEERPEVPDVHEEPLVPDDAPIEERIGEEGLSDAPFEGPSRPVVGIGGGAGGAFKGRGRGASGDARTDPEVDRALDWLAAHQAVHGGWEAERFHETCRGAPAEPDQRSDGAGRAARDVGVTGLALCAFLGAGHTNRGSHPFAKTVSKGLRYLKNVQAADGCFGARDDERSLFDHAVATFAMVQAYGMTQSPIFKGSASKAHEFLLRARGDDGAWRYGGGTGDASVTGWALAAIEAARVVDAELAGPGRPAVFPVDPGLLDATRAWIERQTDRESGRVGPPPGPDAGSETTTAIGVLGRVFLGEDPRTSDPVRRGAAVLAGATPSWSADGSFDLTYWLFGAVAAHQVGGDAWTRWRAALVPALRATQRRDGDACTFAGSWDPLDPWRDEGGRVHSTALAALCLEVADLLPRRFPVSPR